MTLAYTPFTVKILDYAAPTEACPDCGTVCKRHARASRFPADIDIDLVVLLQIIVGVYICNVCGKSFRTPLDFIEKGAHYTNRARTKARESVDDDKMPFTLAARRMQRDFNVSPHETTILRWYRDVTPAGAEGFDYNPHVVQSFSGILCVDEMYDGPFAIVNSCERALKKAMIHRKNSLFYKTERGAHVGDGYMSLIYTCELHHVDSFDYLVALQRNEYRVASAPDAWMPWNYQKALSQ